MCCLLVLDYIVQTRSQLSENKSPTTLRVCSIQNEYKNTVWILLSLCILNVRSFLSPNQTVTVKKLRPQTSLTDSRTNKSRVRRIVSRPQARKSEKRQRFRKVLVERLGLDLGVLHSLLGRLLGTHLKQKLSGTYSLRAQGCFEMRTGEE
jgi:hypothetical protein